MPSHTISSALIKLWFEGGAPWNYTTWKILTGVHHGLFPDDDSHLPSQWTRTMANDIKSFFIRYDAQPTEEKKIKFAAASSGEVVCGRKEWRTWVTTQIAKWKLQALIVSCLKDCDIHPFALVGLDDPNDWPRGDLYIPKAVDEVALRICGTESMGNNGLMKSSLRAPVQYIVQHVWNALRRQFHRVRGNLPILEQKARTHLQALEEKPTKGKVTQALRAISNFRDMAELLGTEGQRVCCEEMTEKVNGIMEALGASVPGDKKKKPLSKSLRDSLLNLASLEDIQDLIRIYQEHYCSTEECDLVDIESLLNPAIVDSIEGIDPGTSVEMSLTAEQLSHALGFKSGLPHQFNPTRHRASITPWDSPAQFESTSALADSLLPMSLHWHQLVGIHSTIRHIFSAAPNPNHCTGMLIADEVGLGKTAQTIATIGFLNDAIWLSEQNSPPPILCCLPYLKESQTIASLPHLIIAPGTLLGQWEHELKTLFMPKKIDILLYGTGHAAHAQFWSPSGPYHQSKHRPHQRIILASHTALQQDFVKCHFGKPPGTRQGLPWDLPPRKPGVDYADTLFGQRYLTSTIDESHLLRNIGTKHHAALLLTSLTIVILLLSATPIQTKPSDISSMGRLIGIRHFFSNEAHDNEKTDASNIRRAKTETDKLQSSVDSTETGKQVNLVAEAQVLAVRRMQRHFEDRIIRRSQNSISKEGTALVDLPPCVDITAYLSLSERETQAIEILQQIAEEKTATANAMGKVVTANFYIEYRQAFSYVKDTADAIVPAFTSMEQWEVKKSTKVDVCARMVRHLLSRDDAPPVYFDDGVPVFPPLPELAPGQIATNSRRILIYQAFPSMGVLLRSVLKLYGIDCVFIDGTSSFEKRNKIVVSFHKPDSPRLLIFSNVGSAGLNLSIADVIILLDQPWSAQDERQIQGRAHRQPQKKTVYMYRLLARNTVDVALNAMAGMKREMLTTLWEGEDSERLRVLGGGAATAADELLQADTQDKDGEGLDQDDGLAAPKKTSRKRKMAVEGSRSKEGETVDGKAIRKKALSKHKSKRIKKDAKASDTQQAPAPTDANVAGGDTGGDTGGNDGECDTVKTADDRPVAEVVPPRAPIDANVAGGDTGGNDGECDTVKTADDRPVAEVVPPRAPINEDAAGDTGVRGDDNLKKAIGSLESRSSTPVEDIAKDAAFNEDEDMDMDGEDQTTSNQLNRRASSRMSIDSVDHFFGDQPNYQDLSATPQYRMPSPDYNHHRGASPPSPHEQSPDYESPCAKNQKSDWYLMPQYQLQTPKKKISGPSNTNASLDDVRSLRAGTAMSRKFISFAKTSASQPPLRQGLVSRQTPSSSLPSARDTSFRKGTPVGEDDISPPSNQPFARYAKQKTRSKMN